MKHFFLIAIALLMIYTGKSQQTTDTHAVDKANYKIEYKSLENHSENAHTVAVILKITGIVASCVGTGMVIVGAVQDAKTVYDDNNNVITNTSAENLMTTGAIVTGAGIITGLSSSIFYVKSGRLHGKAREMRIKMNSDAVNIPVSGTSSLHTMQVGIGLSLSL